MAHISAKMSLLRVLAIDPGTREMGYAVLEESELCYFGVYAFKRRRTARSLLAEGQRFVNALRATFMPQLFVVEKTFFAKSKRSSLLHVFVEELTRLAYRRGLAVRSYAPTAVKKTIAGDGGATKRRVAEAIVRQRFPQLEKYLHTKRRVEEQHWENMFGAVALGLTAYGEIVGAQATKDSKGSTTP